MQEGWICPKCGSVWAPWVGECSVCHIESSSFSGTATRPYGLCWHCRKPIGIPAESGGCGCHTNVQS